jgi:hypothetical protein
MWFMRATCVAALVVAVAMSGAACGGGGSANPAAPAPTPTPTPTPTPIVAQAAGVWTGVNQSTSVDGGECVGVALTAMAESGTAFSLDVAQSGSALTAVSTAPISGLLTNYSGTAGAGKISLTAAYSVEWLRGFACLNGLRRDVQSVSDTINMTVNDNTGVVTAAQTYNVFVAGTTTSVGTMAVTSNFSVGR